MGASAMDTLKRVRLIRERLAELDWMEAEAVQRDQEQVTLDNARRALESHNSMEERSDDMMFHHLYALQVEVTARRDLQVLENHRVRAAEKQVRMRAAQLDTRVVECVEASRAEERALEANRPLQVELDEMGMSGWWRKGSL